MKTIGNYVEVYFTQLDNGAEIAVTAVMNGSVKQEKVVAELRDTIVPPGRVLYSRMVYLYPNVLTPDLNIENINNLKTTGTF
jgi:hypothetical protein